MSTAKREMDLLKLWPSGRREARNEKGEKGKYETERKKKKREKKRGKNKKVEKKVLFLFRICLFILNVG
jgi:hypothetical protein